MTQNEILHDDSLGGIWEEKLLFDVAFVHERRGGICNGIFTSFTATHLLL
jgi:hypothetical protein